MIIDNEVIALAVNHLQQGHVIAYPTEAVYGLGCDPFNEAAVAKLLALKNRQSAKGFILIASEISQIYPLMANITDPKRQQLEESWPGPVTWLVPKSSLVPHWLTGEYDTLALRVSAHPLVKALCQAYGGPIVSTSANEQGQPPARSAEAVKAIFNSRLDFIVPGETGQAQNPSQIRDLLTGHIIRK